MRIWKFKTAPWLLGIAAGAIVILATLRATETPLGVKVADKAPAVIEAEDTPAGPTAVGLTTSFAPVVKKVGPSVVNISSSKVVKPGNLRPFLDDPFFRRFFGDDLGGRFNARPRKEQSLGSGVIVSADGYILTNNHVVDGADEINVTLANDKKDYLAKVVGRDPKTDIAVLKIETKNLPVIHLGNSDKVQVGDVVLAIGSPFGLSQTVTMGIVSGVGRGNMGIEDYEDFIQTDAAINPGNSGGALVDAQGRLLGINTAIMSRTGGSQGVGFAIPVNLAHFVMDRLITNGKVERGYLGVMIQNLTPELAQEFKVPGNQGALVGDVTENSAAGQAGLKNGDVITEFNGKPVIDSRQLRLAVAQCAPGAAVSLKVLRQGTEKSFRVTLKSQPGQTASTEKEESTGTAEDALNSITVGDLDSATRSQLSIPASVRGAVVAEIEENSAAYEAGLRQGDVIQEINKHPIKNAEDAVQATKGLGHQKILLRVWSNGGSRFMVVDESKSK
jgi:serine protease Do